MARRTRNAFFGTLAAVGLVVGCSTPDVLGVPEASIGGLPLASLGGDNPSWVTLCKIGPTGTNATFAVSATGGDILLGSVVTVNAVPWDLYDGSTCKEVWKSSSTSQTGDVFVTVEETGATPGLALWNITTLSQDGWATYAPPTKTATVRVNNGQSALMWFKNAGTSTVGSRGCTPGYWKQSQHFDSWPSAYTPGQAFSSVFANAFPGKSLLQVLAAGGGGLTALGRHTVAALLNSANGAVDYGMTPAQVISAFNAAYASGGYEAQKNIFEGFNERDCPLN